MIISDFMEHTSYIDVDELNELMMGDQPIEVRIRAMDIEKPTELSPQDVFLITVSELNTFMTKTDKDKKAWDVHV
jgi:hypothetical protein